MKKPTQCKAAISSIVIAVVIIVIVVIAGLGAYFLLASQSTSTKTTSTSSSTTTTTRTTTTTTTTTQSTSVTQSSSTSTTTTASSTTSSSTNSNVYAEYNLPYSSSNNTVFIHLIAQRNTTSEENYNLTNFGAMKIYVPLGWNISITLFNNQSTPHSVAIVQNSTAKPTATDIGTQGKIMFIVGNTTDSYQFSGVPGGEEASGVYTNNTASGLFWMTCVVRDHGAAGMWAVLIVSSNVTVPHVVITNPTLTPSTV